MRKTRRGDIFSTMDVSTDALAALRLLIEWGADDALDDQPVDRRAGQGAPAAVPPARVQLAAPAARAVMDGAVAASALGSGEGGSAAALAARASSVDELRALLAGFEGCPLRFTAKSLAFADGNPVAGLVVVGEAPSDDDDREGRPFSGPGGAQFDRVFGSAGLDRSQMGLTFLVPWRPPGKRPPSSSEIASCLPFLQRYLAILRSRRLLLLGGSVTRALGLGTDPIGRLRGTWRHVTVPGLGSVPALPMRPVEAALKSPGSKREMWSDLMTLRAALEEDGQA